MATKAWIQKSAGTPKYKTRRVTRCSICGRRRGCYRKFGICRICFRTMANRGEIPGVVKSSW